MPAKVGQGKITEKFSSRVMFIFFILHRSFFPEDKAEAQALTV